MREISQRHEAVRNLWLNLVRAACIAQTNGYPGAITVTRRFTLDLTDFEVGEFGRTAEHLSGEYRLYAELDQDGHVLTVRISRDAPSAAASSTSPEIASAVSEAAEAEAETLHAPGGESPAVGRLARFFHRQKDTARSEVLP
jgi:hypothetical protein